MSIVLAKGVVQTPTNKESMIHGIHARKGRSIFSFGPDFASALRGFQKRSRMTMEARETRPAAMSTSQGPWKFETKNCTNPKLPPQTRQAGQISTMPRQPTCAATSQNGTMKEKIVR